MSRRPQRVPTRLVNRTRSRYDSGDEGYANLHPTGRVESATVSMTIRRKLWMATTGLFLCIFLVVHLAGNLILLWPAEDARSLYNAYSAALTGSVLIKVVSVVLYTSIVAHVVVSIALAIDARRARGRARYAFDRPASTSRWSSRSMELLGGLVLLFLVIHMKTFWFTYHWGEIGLDQNGHKDLYGVVVAAFSSPWYVALYVGSMVALAFHLRHGIESSFRTLGLHQHRYLVAAGRFGAAFAILTALAFALLPIWVYATSQ